MISNQTTEEKWRQQSKAAQREAKKLPKEREHLLRMARQLQTASQIDQWLSSPALRRRSKYPEYRLHLYRHQLLRAFGRSDVRQVQKYFLGTVHVEYLAAAQ